jgi:DNA-binding transcriptional regulator GbsR (MarR family)
MENEHIKIEIIDKNKDFYQFITNCIHEEEKNDSIEINFSLYSKDLKINNSDIYIIGENNESKVLSLIDRIKSEQELEPYIFIVNSSSSTDFLKKLISKKISGIIDPKNDNCENLLETINRVLKAQLAIHYIKEKIKKLA